MQAQLFTDIPTVEISKEGIFKYILIEGKFKDKLNKDKQQSKHMFVRGNKQLQYHADNYAIFQEQIKKMGYEITPNKNNRKILAKKNGKQIVFECLGGGRIQHNYKGKKCFIYGYSKSFGKIDHKYAKELISKHLGYKKQQIQTSQQGY